MIAARVESPMSTADSYASQAEFTNDYLLAVEAEEALAREQLARLDALAAGLPGTRDELLRFLHAFCHEGLGISTIANAEDIPLAERYIAFGVCGCSARLPITALDPAYHTPRSNTELYGWQWTDWPPIMADALGPVVEYARGILRQGGMGC